MSSPKYNNYSTSFYLKNLSLPIWHGAHYHNHRKKFPFQADKYIVRKVGLYDWVEN